MEAGLTEQSAASVEETSQEALQALSTSGAGADVDYVDYVDVVHYDSRRPRVITTGREAEIMSFSAELLCGRRDLLEEALLA